MELSTFVVAYVIVGVVIGICVLGITSECVEASPSSRPDMSVPVWIISAVVSGIVWPITCVVLLAEYFCILLNRRR